MATTTEKELQMAFRTVSGSRRSISVPQPKATVDKATATTAMNNLMALNIWLNGFSEKLAAAIKTVTTNDLEVA